MDVRSFNRDMWDRNVAKGCRWTVPVDADRVAAAREGRLDIVLTPTRPVPASWLPPLRGARVLGLASGGGQQMPLLAAAGALVTSFDNSPAQLARDREVADREGLSLRTVEGDMADLSELGDASFDFIFHPCANGFVPDVRPVWREAARVLVPGGTLLSGFANPIVYVFDYAKSQKGELEVRHAIPYSDLRDLTPEEREAFAANDEPLMFGHTLDDQIGGQLDAGLVVTGFFEDRDPEEALSKFIAGYIATRALKPASPLS